MLRYKEIFLGSQCNNRCLYCPVCHRDLPTPDLDSLLNSLKEEGDNVAFYGGEPTLSRYLPEVISAAKNNGYRRIKLITNGRAFSDVRLLHQTVNAGCCLFELKLWGSNPELHNHLTGTDGGFQETIRGLENLAGLHEDKFICIRIPVCKENYTDMENVAALALNFGIDRLILSIQDSAVSFQSLIPHIRNAINISIFNRTWISTEGVPFCIMAGLEQHIGEILHGLTAIYERTFEKHKYCTDCIYRQLCPGVETGYLKQFGDTEFIPIPVNKNFQDIKAFYE